MKKPKPSLSGRVNLFKILSLFAYAIILVFVFFNNYNKIFDKKINLGGDNAGYYILGTSIATGQGFTNIHFREKTKHNHFPPGYPLIIAAASKVYSSDILSIKKVNGFFLLLSTGLLFLFFYRLTGNIHIPFITLLFLLYNFHLLSYSTIMMSEIPFLFFSTLSIVLFVNVDFKRPINRNWLFLILIICTSFTYYIRSTGLALVAGFSLYLLIKKNWRYLISLVVLFFISVLPWYIRSKSMGGNAYVSQLLLKDPYHSELGSMNLLDWFKRIWINFERYVTREIPTGVINFISVDNYRDPIGIDLWIIGIGLLIVMVYGLIQLKKYKDIVIYYLVANFGILLLWPDVWFGTRFMLQLIPLLTLFLINGIINLLLLFERRVLKKGNELLILIPLVIISLGFVDYYGKSTIGKLSTQAKSNYPKNYQDYFEIASYVNENTPDTTVVCCRKGQLFYLFSRRYVTGFKSTNDSEEQIEYLKSKKTNYIVLDRLNYSSTAKYLYPALMKYPAKTKLIKKTKETETFLFEFTPELGYSGEREGDKRSGRGSFFWADGRWFAGRWKNNLRNGKGTLYFKNGDYLKGVWINDSINGEAFYYSKEGVILERPIYRMNKKIGIVKMP